MAKKKVTLFICDRNGYCPNCTPECKYTSYSDRAKNGYDIYFDPESEPEKFERSETPNYIYFTEVE